MMMKLRFFLVIIMVWLSVPHADGQADNASLTLAARYQTAEPVTLDLASSQNISTLDPAIASDAVSIEAIENLFLGLTDLDPFTGEVEPELATHWDISTDGKVWTFYLREDVYWYHYKPATETAEPVRPVVAQDVVYGIKRACNRQATSYYGDYVAEIIQGCDIVYYTRDNDVTDELVFGETTQVRAINDWTVEITLQESAGYFLSMTTMWMLRPVPQEAINEFGTDWTLPGNIITNGPYFVHENTTGIYREFIKNRDFSMDLWHGGNIERIRIAFVEKKLTVFALYGENELDLTPVPDEIEDHVLSNPQYQDEIFAYPDRNVKYFVFNYNKPPFDNVHVRRAFSAIIDREKFVDTHTSSGVPMIHLVPPGPLYSLPINEVGIGFNPDYAREQMELAGYPNCEDFPPLTLYSYNTRWAETWVAMAETYLDCSIEEWIIERQESALINWTDGPRLPPLEYQPNTYNYILRPYIPDANQNIYRILYCEIGAPYYLGYGLTLPHPCTDVDLLLEQAAHETDQVRRAELYRQIEEGFFGNDGEFPVAPLFLRMQYGLIKSWATGPFSVDGLSAYHDEIIMMHWDAYTIDMEAKLAARNERTLSDCC